MKLRPITMKEANDFFERYHRHNGPVRGLLFSTALVGPRGGLRGVAIAGRPTSPTFDDGHTVEITRLCLRARNKTPNAASKLYGALRRAARELGYTRAITYTRNSEHARSLVASGWTLDSNRAGDNRPRASRRVPGTPVVKYDKSRWICHL